MSSAAELLWRIYPWIPQLFLADFLLASGVMLYANRKASRTGSTQRLGHR